MADDEPVEEKAVQALDAGDIALLKSYVRLRLRLFRNRACGAVVSLAATH
jgi:hypothetical protein